MRPLLRDLPLFAAVASCKSFSKAAEQLDMYVSTLSRRIAILEKEMGVPLFLRNTRTMELTESGKVLLERSEYILAEAESAWEAVVRNMTRPAGLVRVSMSEDTYHGLLRGLLSDFAKEWPEIRLCIHFNERHVDLLTEPYDVDLRETPFPDSELKARKIWTIDPGVYAAPTLLESYPVPEVPQDLLRMPCIALERIGTLWPLTRGEEKEVVHVRPAHSFTSIALCREFALAGRGVLLLQKSMAAQDEKNGALVRLLPEWSGPCHDIYVVMHGGQLPRRTRVFVDYLVEAVAALRQCA